jgi:hypothetical protein
MTAPAVKTQKTIVNEKMTVAMYIVTINVEFMAESFLFDFLAATIAAYLL